MAAYIEMPAGANAAQTRSSSSAQFAVGTVGRGSSGTEWVYVQASGAIDQYDVVTVDENFQATAATNTTMAASHLIGFAQVAFADNEYGWVATRGSDIQANFLSGALPDAQLWTTATAGHLDDSSASAGQLQVDGVVAIATASAGAGNFGIIATYPVVDEGT